MGHAISIFFGADDHIIWAEGNALASSSSARTSIPRMPKALAVCKMGWGSEIKSMPLRPRILPNLNSIIRYAEMSAIRLARAKAASPVSAHTALLDEPLGGAEYGGSPATAAVYVGDGNDERHIGFWTDSGDLSM